MYFEEGKENPFFIFRLSATSSFPFCFLGTQNLYGKEMSGRGYFETPLPKVRRRRETGIDT